MLALAEELVKSDGSGANRLLTRLQAELRGPEIAKRRDGPQGDVWTNPQDGKEMIRIPAGEFLYGAEKKKINLPEFWIDRTPVTNAEYARFVAATGHRPPRHWEGKVSPEKVADHPVVEVSWHDAVAYAEWAGKRLPTGEEWEKAARGTDGREYPWGNWEEDRCNTKEAGVGSTTPVGRYSPGGDSPYGCVDMAGNVWEWTVVEEGDIRMVRGGSWDLDRDYARCAARVRGYPSVSRGNFGFRCVSPV
jgi:formylglycine-generating enzyme required for sulfatase activity